MYLVDLRGHNPPTRGQKGGPVRPRARRGSVSPNNGLKNKNKKMCVLGKVCGHLASASEQILGQSGARTSASRGRVWPIPPIDPKNRRYTPV